MYIYIHACKLLGAKASGFLCVRISVWKNVCVYIDNAILVILTVSQATTREQISCWAKHISNCDWLYIVFSTSVIHQPQCIIIFIHHSSSFIIIHHPLSSYVIPSCFDLLPPVFFGATLLCIIFLAELATCQAFGWGVLFQFCHFLNPLVQGVLSAVLRLIDSTFEYQKCRAILQPTLLWIELGLIFASS